MKAFEFTTLIKANVPTKLGLFSDIHFDSPDCDRENLTQHLNYCIADGRYILINGDLFDVILLKDMKRAVPHNTDHRDNKLNVKLEELAHFLTIQRPNLIYRARKYHRQF